MIPIFHQLRIVKMPADRCKQCSTGLQNNTCNTNNPTAVRGTEEEKDLSLLSFDHDTSASLKLPFMENENDREIDLLYYDWSDISNFEDVDKMFR